MPAGKVGFFPVVEIYPYPINKKEKTLLLNVYNKYFNEKRK